MVNSVNQGVTDESDSVFSVSSMPDILIGHGASIPNQPAVAGRCFPTATEPAVTVTPSRQLPSVVYLAGCGWMCGCHGLPEGYWTTLATNNPWITVPTSVNPANYRPKLMLSSLGTPNFIIN